MGTYRHEPSKKLEISKRDHIVDESNEGVVKINEVEVELVEYNSSRVLKAEEVEILQFGKNYNQIDESGRNEDIGEKNKDLLEDEDDWEEIERTDLERSFGAVVVFVGSRINDNSLSNEVKMKLHGFWVFFGTLFLKRDWRHAYFLYMWMGLWIRCM
ncbi:acyl-CoA-binding domain-containing protein 3-like [Vigna unguiculata]|uniref:acyl-CoA-binding domain-containing protein 3-like n=1 Tax=Vigna unguiculata TaxID=3917 RepID=UPI00101663EC|nr:acyl-CoA-binding domain-containing protein 3-like [Vigna unguiculata]